MLRQIEGSQRRRRGGRAAAGPEVVCAYPISPQTHIVEGLSRHGPDAASSTPCEYLMVESEFARDVGGIGASAAGARTYTATASQGLLYMAEALYNASGLGLPIVMTVANRAIGAPINIWNDHSDSMSQRDSGWIQLYAETNQEAVDLHIQAFRLAEQLSLPVMVCMDGFILTHAFERVELPTRSEVDAFLPPFEPRQVLDPADPMTIGAMVGPEAFTEVKYLMHAHADAGARRDPAHRRRLRGALRPRRRGASSAGTAPRTRRRSSSRSARCSARSRTWSTSCASEGVKIGAVGDQVLPSVAARGGPRGAPGSRARRRDREGVRRRRGRHRRPERPARAVGPDPVVFDIVAGLGGRPVTRRSLRTLLDDVLGGGSSRGRCTSSI